MTDRLKKSEAWGALILSLMHIVVLPFLLAGLTVFLKLGLSDSEVNFLQYLLSLALTFVFFGKFLRRSFDSLCDKPWHCLRVFVLGWLVYFLLSFCVTFLIAGMKLGNSTPNNDAVMQLVGEDRGMMLAIAFFLAPVVEECIFRGGIFCGLYPKSRIGAYAASVLLFAFYHVWQYVFILGDPRYLLYMIFYLPHSIALCWVYEQSGSLWVSILLHSSLNIYSMYLLGA